MFCQILINDSKNWKNIIHILDKENSEISIITNDVLLNNFLNTQNKNSQTLLQIFPFESTITKKIHERAKNNLEKYRKLFNELEFQDVKIFDSLEREILNDLIIFEKILEILNKKQNYFFIFNQYSFIYFIIQNLASKLGYEVNLGKIFLLTKNGSEQITPNYNKKFSKIKKQFNFVKKSISDDIKYSSQINSSTENNQLKKNITFSRLIKKIPSKIVLYIMKTVFNNLLIKIHSKELKDFFISIDKKIKNSPNQFNFKHAFFLSPARDDELSAVYESIKTFEKNHASYSVFSFDLTTSSLLKKNNIEFIEFSEEIFLISKVLKTTSEFKQLISKIQEIVVSNNLEIFYFKNHWSPLFNKLLFPLSIIICCKHIFSRMIPKSIIVTDGNKIGNSVISVSEKFHISSFSILSLGITPESIHAVYKANKLLVYGFQAFDALTKIGYEKNRIILTGNPRYDYLSQINYEKQKNFLNQKYNIDKNKKLIVIGLSRWYDNDEIWISDYIKFCNRNNFEIIVKVHPFYKITMKEEHEAKISAIFEKCKNQKYLITFDISPSELLPASDLVVTDHSNLGIEAILLDKPLITVNFIQEPIENLKNYFPYEASKYTKSSNLLKDITLDILIDKKYLLEMKQGRISAVKNFNIYNDGLASQRIFNEIINA